MPRRAVLDFGTMGIEPAPTIVVLGERSGGSEPQEAIGPALAHAARAVDAPPPVVRWVRTDALTPDSAADLLRDADAVWCAPGSPFASFDGALEGIRFAREAGIPFLGTCAGFQHAVIEVARNLAGIADADHAEYGREGGDLIIHELLCSLVGQRLDVELVDEHLGSIYGKDVAEERYYCRFGLNPAAVPALHDAGLVVAGVDATDRQPRIMRLVGHPFFVLTLFVPQTTSVPDHPHPIVAAFLAAASAHG